MGCGSWALTFASVFLFPPSLRLSDLVLLDERAFENKDLDIVSLQRGQFFALVI